MMRECGFAYLVMPARRRARLEFLLVELLNMANLIHPAESSPCLWVCERSSPSSDVCDEEQAVFVPHRRKTAGHRRNSSEPRTESCTRIAGGELRRRVQPQSWKADL